MMKRERGASQGGRGEYGLRASGNALGYLCECVVMQWQCDHTLVDVYVDIYSDGVIYRHKQENSQYQRMLYIG